MRVTQNVPLGPLTTFRLGGAARRLVTARTDAELVDAVREADSRGEPVLLKTIGEPPATAGPSGSPILFPPPLKFRPRETPAFTTVSVVRKSAQSSPTARP